MKDITRYLTENLVLEAGVDYVKKFQKQVDEINKLIEQAKKDDISAIETESTWESIYNFDKVVLTKTKMFVHYKEDYTKVKKDEIKFSVDANNDFEETKYVFVWIKKCLKKGYKSEDKPFPKI